MTMGFFLEKLAIMVILSTFTGYVKGIAPLEKGSNHILNKFNLSNSGLIHGTDNLELERYKERVVIVHQMLREECPTDLLRRKRESLSSQIESVHGEVERVLFERMVRMLVQCRRVKASRSTTTPTTTTTPASTTTTTTTTTPTTTTTSTTTPSPTTTTAPPPSECLTATNLTEYWRKDHTGQSVGGTSNCDRRDMVSSDRPWFRFSGAAGTQLLNTCPPPRSCGAHIGMWSDEATPSSVGQSTNITVYGSWTNGCKRNPSAASVMRCTTRPGDFIYRFIGEGGYCNYGFCGMD